MAHLTEANLRRYLLRDLTESEQTEVEDDLFTDESAAEQLLGVEEALIDAYVTNELSQRDRTLFETRFVTSSRRAERVKMAEMLLSHAAAMKPASTVRVGLSLAAIADLFRIPYAKPVVALALIVICAASSAISISVSSSILRREIARSSAPSTTKTVETSTSRREEPPPPQQTYVTKSQLDEAMAQLRERQNRAPETPVLAFFLAPGAVRSTRDAQRLVVPSAPSAIKLDLSITGDENYRMYRALLRDANQNQIWSGTVDGRPTENTRSAQFSVPGSALGPGQYTIELAGDRGSGSFESVQEYFFSVVRK